MNLCLYDFYRDLRLVGVRHPYRGHLHSLLRTASGRGGSFCIIWLSSCISKLDLLLMSSAVTPVKQIKCFMTMEVVFADELAIKKKVLGRWTFSRLITKFLVKIRLVHNTRVMRLELLRRLLQNPKEACLRLCDRFSSRLGSAALSLIRSSSVLYKQH